MVGSLWVVNEGYIMVVGRFLGRVIGVRVFYYYFDFIFVF